LAERVKNARMELGLSQREFARLVGVAQSTVSRWEAGISPPMYNAAALARATRRPPEWFGAPKQRPRVPMFLGPAPDNLPREELDRLFKTRPRRGE
jgi:transcriptional regulator with XRE-family HTH domain